jgi:hypothetical protein
MEWRRTAPGTGAHGAQQRGHYAFLWEKQAHDHNRSTAEAGSDHKLSYGIEETHSACTDGQWTRRSSGGHYAFLWEQAHDTNTASARRGRRNDPEKLKLWNRRHSARTTGHTLGIPAGYVLMQTKQKRTT